MLNQLMRSKKLVPTLAAIIKRATRRGSIASVAAVSLLQVACGSNSALVGSYTCDNFWGFPEIELKGNGTALFKGVTQSFAGNYRVEGQTVILSWASISVPMRVENSRLLSVSGNPMKCTKI